MERVDRFLVRHRLAVLVAWALAVLVAVPFSMHHTDRLTGAFNVPGSQSNEVRSALQRDFDRIDGEDLGAVLVPQPGAGAQQAWGAVARLAGAASKVDDLQLPAAARRQAMTEAAPGETVVVPLRVSVDGDRSDRVARDLRERLEIGGGARDGVTTHLIGEGGMNAAVLDTAQRDAQDAERLAFPVLLVILVVAFGSIVAALLPIGLAFVAITLVLLALLRAPIVAIKAVLMILLSVGAAYGVLVAVFQWGWLAEPLGLDALGYIDPAVPPLVFAIVFGLSMDYQVFLLTRIRERWQEHGDSSRAVAETLASSARTITAAAVTIAAVFATFVFTGVSTVQQTGLGCAVAILIDATLVRLVLVPSAMQILGDRNWWQPKPLRSRAPRARAERLGAPT